MTPIRTLLAAALLASLCTASWCAEPQALVSVADTDVMLIRQTVLYRAAAGTAVRDGDIIETPNGSAQIEIPPVTLLALAPHSRVLMGIEHTHMAACDVLIYSLDAMVKIARTAAVANKSACLQVAQLNATLTTGSAILRFDGSTASLFVEQGELTVQMTDSATPGRSAIKVPAEHMAQWRAGQSVKVLARPTPDFLAALPGAFEDELTPVADPVRGTKSEPVKLREVSYDDIADWLKGLPKRAEFMHQFQPRLSDPAFRRQLDADLGRRADWSPILHPSSAGDAAATPTQP